MVMKQGDHLYTRFTTTKDRDIWEEYRDLRNRVKRVFRGNTNSY